MTTLDIIVSTALWPSFGAGRGSRSENSLEERRKNNEQEIHHHPYRGTTDARQQLRGGRPPLPLRSDGAELHYRSA